MKVKMINSLLGRKCINKYMAADNGTGTGGAGTGEGGTETGNDGTGEGDGSDNGTDDGSNNGDKKFSQADLDKIIEDRLARERKKYSKFKDVDIDEYNRLKTEKAEREDAEKTELEKANEKIQKAEEERKKALEIANKRLILAEFKVLAKESNIQYIDDAYALADLSSVTVNDDGTIEGLKEVVEDLVKEKPFLLQEVQGGTGKVDDKSKGDKGKTKFSFGKQLAEEKKKMAYNNESHYFK